MMRLLIPLGLLCLLVVPCPADGFKVVMFSLFGSQSHLNLFYQVGEGLAEAGHEVTLFTSFPIRNSKKIKEHFFEEIYNLMEVSSSSSERLKNMMMGTMNAEKKDMKGAMGFMMYEFPTYCNTVLENEIIQNLIKKGQQYDVAINNAFLNDCTMPVAVTVAKRLVQLSPLGLSSVMAYELDIPYPYAINPSVMLSYTNPMTFLQRASNSIFHVVSIATTYGITYPIYNEIYRNKFPHLPTVQEAKTKTSLIFINRIAAMEGAVPMLPYVQEIGGINNVPARELPKVFKQFIDSSGEHGFIYVSFGSRVPEEFMPEDKKRMFLEAFSKIPQRVIWKFKENRTDIPPNVKTVKWAPQQDILGHPKCRVFITQGGRLSLDEAIYHAVPVLGMPVFGDQPANIANAQKDGWGLELHWKDLTSDILVRKLEEITKNPRYAKTSLVLSKRMKDEPTTAKQRAVYWIDYVVRNDGAKYLRMPTDHLNIFQYFLLDIIGAALLILTIVSLVMYKLIQLLFCALCCPTKKSNIAKTRKEKKHN